MTYSIMTKVHAVRAPMPKPLKSTVNSARKCFPANLTRHVKNINNAMRAHQHQDSMFLGHTKNNQAASNFLPKKVDTLKRDLFYACVICA